MCPFFNQKNINRRNCQSLTLKKRIYICSHISRTIDMIKTKAIMTSSLQDLLSYWLTTKKSMFNHAVPKYAFLIGFPTRISKPETLYLIQNESLETINKTMQFVFPSPVTIVKSHEKKCQLFMQNYQMIWRNVNSEEMDTKS